jgi:hypothetical protein
MAQLIEFTVGGDESIFVQAEDSAAGPVTRGIGAQSISTRASQTFDEAISRVRPAAEAIVAQLRSLATAPDEVGLEFGLGLSADVGAFIAAASATANFKVTLTWRQSQYGRPDDGDGSGLPANFHCHLWRSNLKPQKAVC